MLVKWMPVVGISFLFMLGGCGDNSGGKAVASKAAEQHSRKLTPNNAALKDTYNRSCRNCHTIAATGAPLTGDVAGWAPRMSKGMDDLVNNVVNGFGGMPPFGMCMDCDVDQFEALIHFMAEAGPTSQRQNQ